MPATEGNARYIRRQRERFEQGRTPPDFPPNDSEVDFTDRATPDDLTLIGRRMLGLDPHSRLQPADAGEQIAGGGESSAIAKCNRILGFHSAGMPHAS